MRQSVFPAFDFPGCSEALLKLCYLGYEGDDVTVKLAAISNLERIKETPEAEKALVLLLKAASNSNALVRAQAARVLVSYGGQQAQTVLTQLRQDSDYRVVKAALEGLL